ncbi:MAG: hypothetical protein LBP59_11770 [Planctomycetaceae bacterium]|jgi:hypothetical protein|nr:hypothetical protein [Planctomycetaceae bacterium]
MQDNTPHQNDNHNISADSSADDNYQTNPPKSGCGGYGCLMGCGIGCIVLIIIAIIAGLFIYYYCIKGIPLQVSPETTIITTPLKSDGKSVDFFSVIKEKTEPQDPTKNNGFKDVLAAYGKEIFANNNQQELNHSWAFEEMCKSLELDPNFTPKHIYAPPPINIALINNIAIQNNKDENNKNKPNIGQESIDEITIFKKVLSKNWNIKEYPELEEWRDKVDSGLDVVQQAAMKELYSIPMIRRNEKELVIIAISPPAIITHNKLIQGLQVRAMLNIGEGNFDKTWKDTLAAIRLKHNLINKGIHIFDQRSEQIKLQIIKTLAESSTKWTAEQRKKAIADLNSIPPKPKREEVLLIAQYKILDVLSTAGNSKQFIEAISGQSLESHPANEQLTNLAGLMELCGFNWNIIAKNLNEGIANYKKTINENDTEKILNANNENAKLELELEKIQDKLTMQIQHKMANMFTVSGRSEIIGFILGETLPILENYIFKQTLTDEVHYRLLQTAIAIEQYNAEHNKYPESINKLKFNPIILPELKTDYKITDKGYKISIGNIELEITPVKD